MISHNRKAVGGVRARRWLKVRGGLRQTDDEGQAARTHLHTAIGGHILGGVVI
jgi:hypothetical protein